MKALGITRDLDCLGRICLPKETRSMFGVEPGTPMEIFVEGDKIILKKHSESCTGCGSMEVVKSVGGLHVCQKCYDELLKAAGSNG